MDNCHLTQHFLLTAYLQPESHIKKFKSAIMKCFKRFSIAKTQPKLKEKSPDLYTQFKQVVKKIYIYGRIFWKIYFLILLVTKFQLKFSCGSSPILAKNTKLKKENIALTTSQTLKKRKNTELLNPSQMAKLSK